MKSRRDYGELVWQTLYGEIKRWGELEDRHLANIYGFFHAHSSKRQSFIRRNPGALAWLKQEAKRRKITHLLKNVVEYGPYPYQNPDGEWVVFDNDVGRAVSVLDYDLDRLPPDARDELQVLMYLGGL